VRHVTAHHLLDRADIFLFAEDRMEQVDRPIVLQELDETKGIEAPAGKVAMADEEWHAGPFFHLGYHFFLRLRGPSKRLAELADGELCGALRGGDAMARNLLEFEQHLGSLQRIAADLEEIVVEP